MATIFTQENVLVNYANVICINPMEIVATTDDGETITVYELAAKTVELNQSKTDDEPSNMISLGVYSTKEKLINVMSELMAFINNPADYNRLFRMPDTDIEEE